VAEVAERRLASLAGRQRGYVTRAQLLELGFGAGAIKYRVAKGALITVYAGVYAVGHAPVSGADRAAAAVLACGPAPS
jgi:Transcriptional regulator, AbiEi antitoxin